MSKSKNNLPPLTNSNQRPQGALICNPAKPGLGFFSPAEKLVVDCALDTGRSSLWFLIN